MSFKFKCPVYNHIYIAHYKYHDGDVGPQAREQSQAEFKAEQCPRSCRTVTVVFRVPVHSPGPILDDSSIGFMGPLAGSWSEPIGHLKLPELLRTTDHLSRLPAIDLLNIGDIEYATLRKIPNMSSLNC